MDANPRLERVDHLITVGSTSDTVIHIWRSRIVVQWSLERQQRFVFDSCEVIYSMPDWIWSRDFGWGFIHAGTKHLCRSLWDGSWENGAPGDCMPKYLCDWPSESQFFSCIILFIMRWTFFTKFKYIKVNNMQSEFLSSILFVVIYRSLPFDMAHVWIFDAIRTSC